LQKRQSERLNLEIKDEENWKLKSERGTPSQNAGGMFN